MKVPGKFTPDGVTDLIRKRYKGRDLTQIEKGFKYYAVYKGCLDASYEFGLLSNESNDVTPLGVKLATTNDEELASIFAEVVKNYEAYFDLLQDLANTAEDETSLESFRQWWSERGYGNEENLIPAAVSFARTLEFSHFGTYIEGRHKRPSRFRWTRDWFDKIIGGEPVAESQDLNNSVPSVTLGNELAPAKEAYNEVTMVLGPGRIVRISLPPRLSQAERQRVIAMIDLL